MRRNSANAKPMLGAAAVGLAWLALGGAPASAATVVTCRDGTTQQASKDCAKHGGVGSTGGAPQPQKVSIFDRWGNLLKAQPGGGAPAKPAPTPTGTVSFPASDLKTSASDPMPPSALTIELLLTRSRPGRFTSSKLKVPLMRQLIALIALIGLSISAAPALAQSWGTAIEQNPMSTACGPNHNIPVAGAHDCPSAVTAAQSLFNTYINTPSCMTTCPAGQTTHMNAPSCVPQSYQTANGATHLRWQINQSWTCTANNDAKRDELIVKKVIVNPYGADVSSLTFGVSAKCGTTVYGFGLNAAGGWQHVQTGVTGACTAAESLELPLPTNPGKCQKPMGLAWVYPPTYAETQSGTTHPIVYTITITNTLTCKRRG